MELVELVMQIILAKKWGMVHITLWMRRLILFPSIMVSVFQTNISLSCSLAHPIQLTNQSIVK
jgi:hypothetical protein